LKTKGCKLNEKQLIVEEIYVIKYTTLTNHHFVETDHGTATSLVTNAFLKTLQVEMTARAGRVTGKLTKVGANVQVK